MLGSASDETYCPRRSPKNRLCRRSARERALPIHKRDNKVHCSLKFGGGIAEPKYNSLESEETMVASERGLLTVPYGGLNRPRARGHVKSREDGVSHP